MKYFIRTISFLVPLFCMTVSAQATTPSSNTGIFEFASPPVGALDQIREFARKEKDYFKFPFAYKDAFFLVTHPSGVSRAELCFLDTRSSKTVTVQVTVHRELYVFADAVGNFDIEKYLSSLLNTIFPDSSLKIKPVKDADHDPVCTEMRMIQWPKNIF